MKGVCSSVALILGLHGLDAESDRRKIQLSLGFARSHSCMLTPFLAADHWLISARSIGESAVIQDCCVVVA